MKVTEGDIKLDKHYHQVKFDIDDIYSDQENPQQGGQPS